MSRYADITDSVGWILGNKFPFKDAVKLALNVLEDAGQLDTDRNGEFLPEDRERVERCLAEYWKDNEPLAVCSRCDEYIPLDELAVDGSWFVHSSCLDKAKG